jgi:iron complex transport system ATP-binding protein
MLEICSISAAYGERQALQAVSLEVHQGEVVALIGPNGAGSGWLKPKRGKVVVNGQDLARLSPAKRASYLSVVPQASKLPPDFTVWNTVLLGRTPYVGWLGQTSPADRERVNWALQRAHIFDIAQRYIGELSGGEQQLVLLARALAQEAPILLLDEPTTHLDLQHQSILLNLVKELAQEQDISVLMVLHDLNLAALYADRVALLIQGRLHAIGAPGNVLTPENLTLAYHIPVHIVTHPDYGTPLILPDGRVEWDE